MANYEMVSSKLNSENLISTRPSSCSANWDPFRQHSTSNLRNFPSKKFGNEDEFRSAVSSQVTTMYCRDSLRRKGKDKLHQLSYTLQLKDDYTETTNGSSTIELKSRQYLDKHIDESPKACHSNEDPVKKSISLTLARVREFEDISSSSSKRVEHFESLKRKHASISPESRGRQVTDLNKLHGQDAHFNTEHLPAVYDKEALKDDRLLESRIGLVEDISSKGKMESYMRSFLGDDKFPTKIKNNCERSEENCGVMRVGISDRLEYLSDMVESRTAVDISPDDVMGVLGEQQFCKTREAIINQQRAFAVQVFELHRLVKVQQLIGASRDTLFEGRPFMRNPAMKASAEKNASLEGAKELSPSIVKIKHHHQKSYTNIECGEDSTIEKLPLPFFNNDTNNRGLGMQKTNYGQYSSKTSPPSEATEPAPWCFRLPPGNMWLVPVMSSSEGLTCKPYTGSCPQNGGFMPPIYGSCSPIQSLDPGNKNYSNAAYGVPLSYQQGIGIGAPPPLLQTYFPPYAAPVINHSSHENPLSFGESKFTWPHQKLMQHIQPDEGSNATLRGEHSSSCTE